MGGFQGQGDSGPCGDRGQGLQGLDQQPHRMASRVAAAAATVEHEHRRAEGGCGRDRLDGVVEAFGERASVAPRKAAGRLEARHADAGHGQHRCSTRGPNVGHLGPPERDRIESERGRPLNLVLEIPTGTGQCADRNVEHGSASSGWRRLRGRRERPPHGSEVWEGGARTVQRKVVRERQRRAPCDSRPLDG